MKKIVFAASFILLLAAVSIAQSDKFQIITEKKGPFGIGGKTVMMLDKETGDTWIYQDNKWVLIPKIEEEVAAKEDAAAVKAKMEEEINALKAKQEEDITALKAKYDSVIKVSAERKSPEKSTAAKQTYRRIKPRVRHMVRKAAPAPVSQKAEGGSEEGPPPWLSE